VKVKEEACTTLRRGGFRELIGTEHIFLTKADAIETVFGRLDKSICAQCDKRIFLECAQVKRADQAHDTEAAAAGNPGKPT
jgi:SulP family sulfate permease